MSESDHDASAGSIYNRAWLTMHGLAQYRGLSMSFVFATKRSNVLDIKMVWLSSSLLAQVAKLQQLCHVERSEE